MSIFSWLTVWPFIRIGAQYKTDSATLSTNRSLPPTSVLVAPTTTVKSKQRPYPLLNKIDQAYYCASMGQRHANNAGDMCGNHSTFQTRVDFGDKMPGNITLNASACDGEGGLLMKQKQGKRRDNFPHKKDLYHRHLHCLTRMCYRIINTVSLAISRSHRNIGIFDERFLYISLTH